MTHTDTDTDTRHSSTALVPATATAVMTLLATPDELPAWNPALTRAIGARETPAAARDSFEVTVLHVLRGKLEYTRVTPQCVAMDIRVPGLRERNEWILEEVEGGTRVTHTLTQTGRLSSVISHQAAVVPGLRLARLRERLAPDEHPS